MSSGGSPFPGCRELHARLREAHARCVVRLQLDPSVVSELEQEFGWYFFHPNVDGILKIKQEDGNGDVLAVPGGHAAPLSATDHEPGVTSLDLRWEAETSRSSKVAAGLPHADVYLLGAIDPADSNGEEDITHIGPRSFVGGSINGDAIHIPPAKDPYAELSWLDSSRTSRPPRSRLSSGFAPPRCTTRPRRWRWTFWSTPAPTESSPITK